MQIANDGGGVCHRLGLHAFRLSVPGLCLVVTRHMVKGADVDGVCDLGDPFGHNPRYRARGHAAGGRGLHGDQRGQEVVGRVRPWGLGCADAVVLGAVTRRSRRVRAGLRGS